MPANPIPATNQKGKKEYLRLRKNYSFKFYMVLEMDIVSDKKNNELILLLLVDQKSAPGVFIQFQKGCRCVDFK